MDKCTLFGTVFERFLIEGFIFSGQLSTESSSDSTLIEWDMNLETCNKASINPLCYGEQYILWNK